MQINKNESKLLQAFFDTSDQSDIVIFGAGERGQCLQKNLISEGILVKYFSDNFKKVMLDPVLLMSDGVADTSELFMRSYQMISMFPEETWEKIRFKPCKSESDYHPENNFDELKIGQLAQATFKKLFSSEVIDETLLMNLQSADYSKQFFDLNFPLLVLVSSDFPHSRYYTTQHEINGKNYRITNDWYERSRSYLLKWWKEQEESELSL